MRAGFKKLILAAVLLHIHFVSFAGPFDELTYKVNHFYEQETTANNYFGKIDISAVNPLDFDISWSDQGYLNKINIRENLYPGKYIARIINLTTNDTLFKEFFVNYYPKWYNKEYFNASEPYEFFKETNAEAWDMYNVSENILPSMADGQIEYTFGNSNGGIIFGFTKWEEIYDNEYFKYAVLAQEYSGDLFFVFDGSMTHIGNYHGDDHIVLKKEVSSKYESVKVYKNGEIIFEFNDLEYTQDMRVGIGLFTSDVISGLNCNFSTELEINKLSNNVNYHNTKNGTAKIMIKGGTKPYRIAWDDSKLSSFEPIGLDEGVYPFHVIDTTGKTIFDTLIIHTDITWSLTEGYDKVGKYWQKNKEDNWENAYLISDNVFEGNGNSKLSFIIKDDSLKMLIGFIPFDTSAFLGLPTIGYKFQNGAIYKVDRTETLIAGASYSLDDVFSLKINNGIISLLKNNVVINSFSQSLGNARFFATNFGRNGRLGNFFGEVPHRFLPEIACLFDKTNQSQNFVYDETGAIVSNSVSFFDGFGRNFQNQVKLNTDNNVIATKTIFDYHGRPLLNTLPAPVYMTNPACLYGSFVKNNLGQNYSAADFDKDEQFFINNDVGTENLQIVKTKKNERFIVGQNTNGTAKWTFESVNNSAVNQVMTASTSSNIINIQASILKEIKFFVKPKNSATLNAEHEIEQTLDLLGDVTNPFCPNADFTLENVYSNNMQREAAARTACASIRKELLSTTIDNIGTVSKVCVICGEDLPPVSEFDFYFVVNYSIFSNHGNFNNPDIYNGKLIASANLKTDNSGEIDYWHFSSTGVSMINPLTMQFEETAASRINPNFQFGNLPDDVTNLSLKISNIKCYNKASNYNETVNPQIWEHLETLQIGISCKQEITNVIYSPPSAPYTVIGNGTVYNPKTVPSNEKGSLGWYYSNNNTEEKFVPASAYPFTRTELTADPNGQAKAQAIAGEAHRMGSGKETKVYTVHAGNEAIYVLGNSHFDKNPLKQVSVDPDGKTSIVYANEQGNVLATAISNSGLAAPCSTKTIYRLDYVKFNKLDLHITENAKSDFTFSLINTSFWVNDMSKIKVQIFDLTNNKQLRENTHFTISNTSGTFTKRITFTGAYATGQSFFRFKLVYDEAYYKSIEDYYGNVPDDKVGLDFTALNDYTDWTVNYYDNKGQLLKTVPPKNVQCIGFLLTEPSSNNYINATQSCVIVEELMHPDYMYVHNTINTLKIIDIDHISGYNKSFKFNIRLKSFNNFPDPPIMPYRSHGTGTGASGGNGGNGSGGIDGDPYGGNNIINPQLINPNTLTQLSGATQPNPFCEETGFGPGCPAYLAEPNPSINPSECNETTSVPYARISFKAKVYGKIKPGSSLLSAYPSGVYPIDDNGKYYGAELNKCPYERLNLNKGIWKTNYIYTPGYSYNIGYEVYNELEYVYVKYSDPTVSFKMGDGGSETSSAPFNHNAPLHTYMINQLFFLYEGIEAKSLPVPSPVYHTNANTYKYSSLGQVLEVDDIDKGISEFVYTNDGKLRFTQNAKQKNDFAYERFSYINYDKLGRPIEAGEYMNSNETGAEVFEFKNHYWAESVNGIYGTDNIFYLLEMQDGLDDNNCTDQAFMQYDKISDTDRDLIYNLIAKYPEFTEGKLSKSSNKDAETFYSYNYQNRLMWILKSVSMEGESKRYYYESYQYDFFGAVTRSEAMLLHPDYGYPNSINNAKKLYHHYVYDADKRLKDVLTSEDGNIANATRHTRNIYYQHGAMEREELGDRLQGIDYVYTINGWLKSINNPHAAKDPGQDGFGTSLFEQDVFSQTLDYFKYDYNRRGTYIENYGNEYADGTNAKNHYSGLIKATRWNTRKVNLASQAEYNGHLIKIFNYDYKNQLTQATFGEVVSAGVGNPNGLQACSNLTSDHPAYDPCHFGPSASLKNDYKEHNISYDKNGNILTFFRNGFTNDGTQSYLKDKLTYHYTNNTNKLHKISDEIATNLYAKTEEIHTGQSNNNYSYNSLGQMIGDVQDELYQVYNAGGLVTEVYEDAGYGTIKARFVYDEAGKRIKKHSYHNESEVITYYFYNVSGICTFEETGTATKAYLYGSRRIGVFKFPTNESEAQTLYELTDNIGNVRAVINSQRESEEVWVESFADYYSFGLPMPGQHANTQEYELDYQGQRKDAETGFNAFELRMFDARIGRWMAPDPYEQHWSPYLAMSNNPIMHIDPDGGTDVPQANADSQAAEDLERAHNMRMASLAKFHGDVNSEIYSDLSPRDREDIITMNPHMRDQLQNYYGSTSAAQDINRIFTLASLGGYKDKDGNMLHALNGKLGYYEDNYVFKEIRFPTLDPVTGITTIHDNSTYDNVPIFVPISGGGGGFNMGIATAIAGLGFASAAEVMYSEIFETWMGKDGKIRSQDWGGNKAIGGKNKFAKATAGKIKVGGVFVGIYGILNTVQSRMKNEVNNTQFGADLTMGIVSFFGLPGAILSMSYELGKSYGPSTWFNKSYIQPEHECVLCPKQ